MHCTKKITDDLHYVGGNDRRINLFENVFPVENGVSYNSYLLLDEKTVLLDTVDRAISDLFLENVDYLLAGRPLDYLIINHMEPDHCATLKELVVHHPELKIVGNSKILTMINQFFDFDAESRFITVAEGDTLSTGKHCFAFVMAPMVHWPEAMVSFDTTDKILFSADAFGSFGALSGCLFADEYKFEEQWLPEARRYFTNIVGKYGPQVQALLKKAETLEIKMVCPLHGPLWRENIGWFIEKYQRWSTYTPEDKAVMIAYASVYGNTENAANILATKLSDQGLTNIVMYDVSVTHPSYIVSEAFRCSHLVFASTTYNAGIFCNMETALLDIKQHNLQNRTLAFIENGTWAPASGRLMCAMVGELKGMNVIAPSVTIKSSVKEEQLKALESLAAAIADSVKNDGQPAAEERKQKGFRCKICGFEYQGDTLPHDYICPVCGRGAEDFEPIK